MARTLEQIRRPVLASVALFALVGCQDVELRTVNRTVTVEGRYCTNDSTTFGVPLRILLVVDTSESMRINDPMGNRGKAAARLVNGLMDKNYDVSFAFAEFNTAAEELTPGFIKDRAQLLATAESLNNIEGFTNYLDALGLAKIIINADLVKTAEELRQLELEGQDTRFKRPWYFVIFLSDGIPRMPGGVLQSTDSILFQARNLMDVPREATGITLHTAFLGALDDALRPEAEVLLKRIAEIGNGTYFSFTRGEDIDFSVFDFQIKRLFDIKQFLVYNRSAALPVSADAPEPDSDMDGLSDREEMEEHHTDPLVADTDGDGLGDGYELRVALDPLKPNSVCTGDQKADSDADGLNDCEENFLNLDNKRFDSDGDLFPDHFELISGTNPGDGADVKEDLDFDQVFTHEELRLRTTVGAAARDLPAHYGYSYQLTREFDSLNGQVCYPYRVSNVGLTQTRAAGGREAGVNEVVLDFIESPEDRPEELFSLNRFVFTVQYADHETGTLTPGDVKFTPISSQEVQLPR